MRNDYSSMKPFEVRCRWWRPERPLVTAPGNIGFDGKNLITGMDDWIGPEPASNYPRVDILHAEMIDGTNATVYNAFVQSTGHNVRLEASAIAVGEHLEHQTEQKFSEVEADVNGLDEWWLVKRYKCESAGDGSDVVHFAAPTGMSFSVPERSLNIAFGEEKRQNLGVRVFDVVYKPYLRFVPDNPQTIDWFHEIVLETRQLLSLFCNQDTALIGLRPILRRGRDLRDRIDWYWSRGEAEVKKINRSRILLTHDLLESQLQDVLTNWLSKTEALRHARALFFLTRANPGPFLETRFLPIIQALEVYCSALGSEKYIPRPEFNELKRMLFDFIPGNLDNGLKQRLHNSIGVANELSLKDRILQLLNSLEQGTRHFVCQDAEKFASRLTSSRNFYTHYGDSKGKELKGNALHWATKQTELLLNILMLVGCGVSESLIQERLKQSWHHIQGAQLWAKIEGGL